MKINLSQTLLPEFMTLAEAKRKLIGGWRKCNDTGRLIYRGNHVSIAFELSPGLSRRFPECVSGNLKYKEMWFNHDS